MFFGYSYTYVYIKHWYFCQIFLLNDDNGHQSKRLLNSLIEKSYSSTLPKSFIDFIIHDHSLVLHNHKLTRYYLSFSKQLLVCSILGCQIYNVIKFIRFFIPLHDTVGLFLNVAFGLTIQHFYQVFCQNFYLLKCFRHLVWFWWVIRHTNNGEYW